MSALGDGEVIRRQAVPNPRKHHPDQGSAQDPRKQGLTQKTDPGDGLAVCLSEEQQQGEHGIVRLYDLHVFSVFPRPWP